MILFIMGLYSGTLDYTKQACIVGLERELYGKIQTVIDLKNHMFGILRGPYFSLLLNA